jgi:hypothetical protein
MMEKYVAYLQKTQQLDGGFGYYKNDGSMVEPTCYALMALNAYNLKENNIKKAIEWLLSMQNSDGGWFLFEDDNMSSPFSTGLAVLALNELNTVKFASEIKNAITYLETVKGFHTTGTMDEDAWGWNPGGFISIEPTAYAILALKATKSKANRRIHEGEKFFYDNKCYCGGWTYGYPVDANAPDSKEVIYKPLEPQLHITALVLLATYDSQKEFTEHYNYILRAYKTSYCPLSLSLAAMAVDCYEKDSIDIVKRVNQLMQKDEYVSQMPIFNALSLLANLLPEGKNPLCLRK